MDFKRRGYARPRMIATQVRAEFRATETDHLQGGVRAPVGEKERGCGH